MPRAFATGIVLSLMVLAGCSSSSTPTATTVQSSPACDNAVAAVASQSLDASDAAVRQADDATLTVCGSRAAWLAAAKRHPKIAIGNTAPAAVLAAFCHDTALPATPPACR